MILYVETSALIKMLIDETGSAAATRLWDVATARVTSRITYPEGRAALAAANRAGRLPDAAHVRAKSQLGRLVDSMASVELTEAIAMKAGEIAEAQQLRGYDAVHMASALAVFSRDLVLATWDADLVRAADAIGVPRITA